MAISQTPRLGVTVWTSGDDEFLRQQMEDSHTNLEARAAMFLSGPIANRPAAVDNPSPGTSNNRAFYLATDQTANGSTIGTLYMSNGVTWVALNNFATAGASAPGDSASAGTAATVSRSDHRHSTLPFGPVGSIADVSTAKAAGTAAEYARADHVHQLANNSVTAGKIAAGGVSATDQLADDIVTSAKLAPGAVDSTAIAADQRIPVGSLMPYAGSVAPTGWLLCNGASYATANYSALFAVIGYTYGGAGANFNVPDTMGRTVIGVGTGTTPIALTARTLGQKSGVETVTLTHLQSGVAAHSHTLGSHTHSTGTLATAGNSGLTSDTGGSTQGPSNNTSGDTGGSTGQAAGTYGTQTAANNQSHFHTSGQTGGAQGFVMAGTTGTGATIQVGGSAYVYKDYTANENQIHAHDFAHTHPVNNHNHTLSSHTHAVNNHNHTLNNHSHTVTGSTGGPAGSSDSAATASAAQGHDNMQPFIALNYIIKI